jgi:hypothetical protein
VLLAATIADVSGRVLSCSDFFPNPLILGAARRRQLRSLGYALYEACLCRRGQSPVIALI